MKCDELKDYDYDPDFPFQSRGRFYDAYEVDDAIAELKDEINRKEGVEKRWFARCMEARTENVRLKRELEHVKNGDCINTCDVVEKHVKEEIKAKRNLWLARANRALEKIAWFKLWNASISTMNPEDGSWKEYDKWKKNLGKFLKKSKEYL